MKRRQMKPAFLEQLVEKYCLISLQFSNETILAQVRKRVPLRLKAAAILASSRLEVDSVRWFQKFMHWSKNPRLKRFSYIPILLERRIGRCGEWAILYTAVMCSLGLIARLVLDFNDHVWTEILTADGTWKHIDSSLNPKVGINNPSFYQKVWKRKKTKVLAFSPNRVEDVTARYYG